MPILGKIRTKSGFRAGILAQVMPRLHSTAVAMYNGAPYPVCRSVMSVQVRGMVIHGR